MALRANRINDSSSERIKVLSDHRERASSHAGGSLTSIGAIRILDGRSLSEKKRVI
jgi:hypothetical protein